MSTQTYQTLYELDDPRKGYNVTSIFQDGGHSVANLLPFSDMVTSHVSEGTKLLAHQISSRYLKPQLRYLYFRFLKANGRHTEILLAVSILTVLQSWACDSALTYQLLCKLDDRRRRYDVILILQDGGHSVANLLPVSNLATSHILRRSKAIGIPNFDQISIHGRDITISGF